MRTALRLPIFVAVFAIGIGETIPSPAAEPKAASPAAKVTYLDDLPELPGKVTNGEFYGIHGKTGLSTGIVQQVRVKGVAQTHAISLHANSKGTVHVDFAINKEFESFRGKAGFFQATAEDGLDGAKQAPNWNGRTAKSPVTFAVVGDGKTLWTSRPIQAFDDWQDFNIEVRNVQVLRLEVTCKGAANFCWSAWADPALVRAAPNVVTHSTSPNTTTPGPDGATELVFPEPVTQLRWGGGGKYLIGHLPKAAQLIVYDIEQTRELKRIDLGGQNARFAANQTDLVVAVLSKTLQRFDLQTLERKALVPYLENTEQARMGFASKGPLMLWSKGSVELFDPLTLKPLSLKDRLLDGDPRYGFEARVSADGQTFVGWTTGLSGQRFNVMRLENDRVQLQASPEDYSHAGWWAQPNADGSMLLLFGGGLFTSGFRKLSTNPQKDAVWIPPADPRFLVALTPMDDGKSSRIAFYTAAGLELIHTMDRIEPMAEEKLDRNSWGYLSGEPRLMLVPELKRLACVPSSNDRVIVRRLDLIDLIKKGSRLIVFSKPKRTLIKPGEKFEYQIEALSPAPGAVEFTLASAPPGMKISAQGLVTWTPEKQTVDVSSDVVVSVRDKSNQEVLHQFQLSIPAPPAVASTVPPPTGNPSKPGTGTPIPDSPSAKNDASPPTVVSPEDALKLVSDSGFPVLNLKNDGAWLIQGNELWQIGADGASVGKKRKLRNTYKDLRERAEYFVAIRGDNPTVDILDKSNLAVVRSTALAGREITDVALHPTKPIAYVAMKVDVRIPRYRFVVFNELSGKSYEDNDLIGTWVAVTRDGRHLITGYRDIYEKGAELIMNPDQWHIVPTYGGIDWLIRYDLDSGGKPRFVEAKPGAGGNGKGLRMSNDCERVTYLSHVGYPPFSRNLGGFATQDFKESPVMYATKDIASTNDLAYHPTLPLVASPGSGSAVFFHRETGMQEDNRLKKVPAVLSRAETNRIFFSPDAANLVFDVKVDSTRYLVKAPLNMTAGERRGRPATSSSSSKSPPAAAKPVPVRKPAPLREIDALAGGQSEEMTAAAISQAFSKSVVIVANDEGSSGSGLVVGSGGFVLTCAHCVSETSENWVHYRNSGSGDTPPSKSKADVINIDADKDIALLKIAARLHPVRLAVGHSVASGERVSVIGNPGLGSLILEQTITDGIVSNPSRNIDGQVFIQISAAVNPGSSGSPMFNSQGMVIGMVSLKGKIEGAGFGINTNDLGRFIVASTKQNGADGQLQREWVDGTGKFRIVAAYQGVANGKVKLVNPEREIEISRLSKPDQEFIKLISGRYSQFANGRKWRITIP